MSDFDQSAESFYAADKAGGGYLSSYITSHSPRCKWMVERFGLDKIKNSRVLGIGEGVGMNFQYMDQSNYLVGIDGAIIPREAKLCPFLNLRADLNRPDFGILFDNEEKFDYLIAAEVIEHVSFVNNLMRQMKRLLKPNGTAFFTVPHQSVTHPTSMPGIFFPEGNFAEYIQQWAFIIEDYDMYTVNWPVCAFKVRNAPIQEAKPRYFKHEAKFINSEPDIWPNL